MGYDWRWHIELDFRAIKAVMQMVVLRWMTPAMIEKEIAAPFQFQGRVQQLRAFERNVMRGWSGFRLRSASVKGMS